MRTTQLEGTMSNPVAVELAQSAQAWGMECWHGVNATGTCCIYSRLAETLERGAKEIEDLEYALNVKLKRPTTYYGHR